MSPDEMRANSKKKVQQIAELAKVLKIKIEARQKLSADGFLENIVFFIDEEKYPEKEIVEKAAEATLENAPTGEATPDHA